MTDRIVFIYLSLLGLNAIPLICGLWLLPLWRAASRHDISDDETEFISCLDVTLRRGGLSERTLGTEGRELLGASVKVYVQTRFIRWWDWICIVSRRGPSQRILGTDGREVEAGVRIRNEEQMHDIPIYEDSGRFSNCARHWTLSANCAV